MEPVKVKIKIEDLIPKSSSFKLKRFDDFEFKLMPCTSGKLIDMSESIGNVESLLAMPNAENISKLALSLMEYDSAIKFKKQEVKIVDVLTGDEKNTMIGGYKILMHSMNGIKEQYSVLEAVFISLGYGEKESKEIIQNLIDNINGIANKELKKKVKK